MKRDEDPSYTICRYECNCNWDPGMIFGTWTPDANRKSMEVRENERQQDS